MMETGYSLADIAAATGNNNNNDGFGGNGSGWWIILLFLALANGNWGGNNNGGGNGGYGYSQPIVIDSGRSGGSGCGCSPCATQADLSAAFASNATLNGINGIDSALCQGFNGIQQSLMSGFAGVDRSVCTLGYNQAQLVNGLSRELADCCCGTKQAIADVKYTIGNEACETRHSIYNSTRDIIDNANANSRAILDFLTQDKISSLQAENQALKFQASQTAQNAVLQAAMDANTATILRRTGAECPTAAYIVQPPQPVTFPTNCCGGVNYANFGNGCGCGSY